MRYIPDRKAVTNAKRKHPMFCSHLRDFCHESVEILIISRTGAAIQLSLQLRSCFVQGFLGSGEGGLEAGGLGVVIVDGKRVLMVIMIVSLSFRVVEREASRWVVWG